MSHIVEKHQDQLVVCAIGKLDFQSTGDLRDTLKATLEAEHEEKIQRLILDLAEVSFIDSSGLGLLITTRTSCNSYGYEFALRNVKGFVKKAFERVGLTKFFIIEDLEVTVD